MKFEVGKDEEGNPIYEEIENIRWVNYDQLYKANIGATQKLIRKIETQQNEINSLRDKLTVLENIILNNQ